MRRLRINSSSPSSSGCKSAAAEALFLTQPAVSKRVAQLEAELKLVIASCAVNKYICRWQTPKPFFNFV